MSGRPAAVEVPGSDAHRAASCQPDNPALGGTTRTRCTPECTPASSDAARNGLFAGINAPAAAARNEGVPGSSPRVGFPQTPVGKAFLTRGWLCRRRPADRLRSRRAAHQGNQPKPAASAAATPYEGSPRRLSCPSRSRPARPKRHSAGGTERHVRIGARLPRRICSSANGSSAESSSSMTCSRANDRPSRTADME